MNYIPFNELFIQFTSRAVNTQEKMKAVCEFIDPNSASDEIDQIVTQLIANKVIPSRVLFDKAMKYWARRRSIAAKIGAYPETASQLVQMFALKEDVDIRINGMVTKAGAEYTASSFQRDIRILCDEPDIQLPFNKQQIEDAASWHKEEVIKARRAELREKVQYSAEAEQAAEADWQALDSCFNNPALGFAAATYKKFIHQVKCKMHDVPVLDHLVAIMTGAGGSGKTTLGEMLVSPMEDVTYPTNVAELLDKKNIDMWNNYIITLPEMHKADRADIAGLKEAVTGKSHGTRRMYSNESDHIRRKATLLGDSNLTLDMLLKDPTGMRRFVQNEFQKLPDYTALRAKINAIDYLRLWQSIDHLAADPMKPFAAVLLAQQEKSRVPHAVEEWLADPERDLHRVAERYYDERGGRDGEGKYMDRDIETYALWTPNDWKQATSLYLENFKPWNERMKKGFPISSNVFFEQMNMILRDFASLYGLKNKKPANKSMWLFDKSA